MRLTARFKRSAKFVILTCLTLVILTFSFYSNDNQNNRDFRTAPKHARLKELIQAKQKKLSRNFSLGLNEAHFKIQKSNIGIQQKLAENFQRKDNERKLHFAIQESPTAAPSHKKTNLTELKRVKNFGYNVFLYTAIVGNSSTKALWDRIVIQGWEDGRLENTTSICCVRYNSGVLLAFKIIKKISWLFKNHVALPVKQYICPSVPKTKGDFPTHATITADKCHSRFNWYVQTEFAYRHFGKIAVCTKTGTNQLWRPRPRHYSLIKLYLRGFDPQATIAYGSLSAADIISWFEVQKLMGVDKVVTYAYNLNQNATRVLRHYEDEGIAEVLPFYLPKKVPYRPKVNVGTKNTQGWNDEQIPVYDCLERLKGYTYLVTIDMDEYLVPVKDKDWPGLFRRLWKKKPKAAGFTFLVQLHIISWGPTNSSSEFKIGRYLNRTAAMTDRMKHVTLPSRLVPGGLGTHSFGPRFDLGFHRAHAPSSYATLHHFRSCRKEWTRRSARCYSLTRYRDESVARLYRRVERNIKAIKSNLTV